MRIERILYLTWMKVVIKNGVIREVMKLIGQRVIQQKSQTSKSVTFVI